MRYLKYLFFTLFLAFFTMPGVSQITQTPGIFWPVIDPHPDDKRVRTWSAARCRWENDRDSLICAVVADTTALDTLTHYYDRRWNISVTSKTSQNNGFDSVRFNIGIDGKRFGGASRNIDTTFYLAWTYDTWVEDALPGIDIWFRRSDSISTGDKAYIIFSHTWYP